MNCNNTKTKLLTLPGEWNDGAMVEGGGGEGERGGEGVVERESTVERESEAVERESTVESESVADGGDSDA
jgi:hypothetical protein